MLTENMVKRTCGPVRNNIYLFCGFFSFTATAMILLYLIVFLVVPSSQFIGAKQEECIIRKAKLSCWRKKLLNSDPIEQGSHKCWLFTVMVGNVSQQVQHNTLRDFPLENDGCSSACTCGMEVWPCRLDKDMRVRLRWSYPVNNVVYCSLGIVGALLCGGIAVFKYFYVGKGEGSDEEQAYERYDSSIPFSFNENESNDEIRTERRSLASLV